MKLLTEQSRSSVSSRVLDAVIFLNILFSNTPNLCSSLKVTDQIHHNIQQQVKLWLFVYFNAYIWVANWRTKDSGPNDSEHSLTSVCF